MAEVNDLPILSPIAHRSAGTAISDSIDKSRLAHPEPRRARDKAHVKFVAKHACLICGRGLQIPITFASRSPARWDAR